MRPIPTAAAEQFGVFTRAQALKAGWTRSALQHAVDAASLCRLRPGVFVAAHGVCGTGPDAVRHRLVVETAGALLTTSAAVASHASAAVLNELPVWRLPNRPCLTVPPRHTGDASAVHLHRAALPRTDRRRTGPLARTSVARTVLDLGREHGVEQAVVAADAALHEGLATLADVVRCLARCRGWPGIRRALHAVALLDGRSESPIESVSRLRLMRTSVPTPDIQPNIYSTSGALLARVDFYWDDVGVAGEVDGKVKYVGASNEQALWQEKLRQERLENAGLVVVRWGHLDLRDLSRLANRIHTALRRAGRRAPGDRQWIARPTSQAG